MRAQTETRYKVQARLALNTRLRGAVRRGHTINFINPAQLFDTFRHVRSSVEVKHRRVLVRVPEIAYSTLVQLHDLITHPSRSSRSC